MRKGDRFIFLIDDQKNKSVPFLPSLLPLGAITQPQL